MNCIHLSPTTKNPLLIHGGYELREGIVSSQAIFKQWFGCGLVETLYVETPKLGVSTKNNRVSTYNDCLVMDAKAGAPLLQHLAGSWQS